MNHSPTIPPEIISQIEAAMKTGRWMVAIFRSDGKEVQFDRTATNWDTNDLGTASRLFVQDMESMKPAK
jgi:hypothetical protein